MGISGVNFFTHGERGRRVSAVNGTVEIFPYRKINMTI